MRLHPVLCFISVLLIGVLPHDAGAQGGCLIDCPPNSPPSVRISPSTNTHVSNPSFTFTVTLSDDGSLDVAGFTATTALSGTWGPNNSWGSVSGTVTLSPGPNMIFAKIADTQGLYGADTVTIYYDTLPTPPSQAKPTLTFGGYSNTIRHVVGCSGCLYGTYRYSTPAYVSRDVPRSVTLMYSSAQAAPQALVQVDANVHTTTVPDYISMLLVHSATAHTLTNGGNEAFYTGDTGTVRLAAQFDASALGTGVYQYAPYVRAWWGGSYHEDTIPARVLIINEQSSNLGAGWSISGLQRVWTNATDSVALTDGAGGIVFYARSSSTAFARSAGSFDTLSVSGGVYTLLHPDGSLAHFNSSGFLTATKNRFGDSTSYGYDSVSHNLTAITDEAGKTTTLTYYGAGTCPSGASQAGKLCRITTPGGRNTDVIINSSGDLVQLIDPDNVTAFTGTYSSHLLTAATNRLNASTGFRYDSFTGLDSIIAPSVTVTDTSGSTSNASTVVKYGSIEFRLLATNNHNSTVPKTRVRADSAWATVTAPNGTVTEMVLQGAGEPTRVEVHPLAGYVQTTTTAYNSDFLPTAVTMAPVGGTTTYTWSGSNLTNTTDPNGTSTLYSYAAYGQRANTWLNGWDQVEGNYYSGTYATLDSTVAGTSKTTFTWDGHGRLAGTSDRQSHTTARSYESGGFQNTSDAWVGGSHWVFTHDQYGRDSSATDPDGTITSVAYDAVNRIASITQPGSATTTTSYSENTSAHTLTTTVTDPRSLVFTTVANALGLPTSITDPQSHSTTAGYDVNGAVRRVVDRTGGVTTFIYDSLGRVLKRSAGSNVATYSYDNNNGWTDPHFVAVTHGEGADTLVTDASGRETSHFGTLGSLSVGTGLTYDTEGNRSTLHVDPGNGSSSVLTFGVDSLQRPNALPDWVGNEALVRYTNEQLLDTLVYPTGGSSTRLKLHPSGYDHFGHPTLVQMSVGSSVVAAIAYAYDTFGRISTITTGPFVNRTQRKYTYDVRGRLSTWADSLFYADSTQEACPDMQLLCDPAPPWDLTWHSSELASHSYSPDFSGNRTDGSASLTHDRLTSMTGADGRAYTISYDSAGHITEKAASGYSQKYTWNTLGQLAWVNTNGDSVNYGYDPNGHRVRQTHNGVKTYYVWDGDNMMMEVDSTGTPRYMYSYLGGLDQPLSVTTGGATYYYQLDQLGDVVGVWNTSNSVVAGYDYDPYGYAITTAGSVAQPLRWKGAQFDSTGLYYMRARYYDPAIGRFLSEDPIGLAGGINPYAFGNGDPINATDPRGLASQEGCSFAQRINGLTREYKYKDAAGKEHTGCMLPSEYGEANPTGPSLDIAAERQNAPIAIASFLVAIGAVGWPALEAAVEFVDGGGPSGSPSTPIGRRGNQLYMPKPSSGASVNAPGDVNGVSYSGHAFDSMQSRGFFPSLIENALENGEVFQGHSNAQIFYDAVNDISVVRNPNTGNVITVRPGAP